MRVEWKESRLTEIFFRWPALKMHTEQNEPRKKPWSRGREWSGRAIFFFFLNSAFTTEFKRNWQILHLLSPLWPLLNHTTSNTSTLRRLYTHSCPPHKVLSPHPTNRQNFYSPFKNSWNRAWEVSRMGTSFASPLSLSAQLSFPAPLKSPLKGWILLMLSSQDTV